MTFQPEELRPYCERHGLLPPAAPMAPGSKDRLYDAEKTSRPNGYIYLFPDGAGGFIQNHRNGPGEVFFFDGRQGPMSYGHQQMVKRAREEARRIQESEYRAAALECRRIWEQLPAARPDHPYVARKRLGGWIASYCREMAAPIDVLAKWALLAGLGMPLLVVPVMGPDNLVQGLQYIGTTGGKLYHPGARMEHGHLWLGTMEQAGPGPVMVAEGLATAASVVEATMRPCLVTFDAGNMPRAAEAARQRHPEAQMWICADNDSGNLPSGFPRPNKGLIKGEEAAAAVGAWLVAPEAAEDFNDVAAREGSGGVSARLGAARFVNVVRRPAAPDRAADEKVADLWAYLPLHKYFYAPTGDLWPAESIDATMPRVPIGNGKFQKASAWLDANQAVTQATWVPGEPMIIEDRLILDGGWMERKGDKIFNLYRPPVVVDGNPAGAERWLAHMRRVWPTDWEHIVRWFAHRIQRPGDKVNHALVLGGRQGIGKDTAIEPLKYGVGAWNVAEVSPREIVNSDFNGYLKSVVLRISESRDMGDAARFAFYDQMKTLCAAPPDVLRCNDKHVKAHTVPNVTGVIYTTNYKTGGMFLDADDRRHYVAWSECSKSDFSAEYWSEMWGYYMLGGLADVVSYLRAMDLSEFNPKAPPAPTEAFWEMVNSNRSGETGDIINAIEALGNPPAIVVDQIRTAFLMSGNEDMVRWMDDKRNQKAMSHRLEDCGYTAIRNPDDRHDGMWKVGTRRVTIYARTLLERRERLRAAGEVRQDDGAKIVPMRRGII